MVSPILKIPLVAATLGLTAVSGLHALYSSDSSLAV